MSQQEQVQDHIHHPGDGHVQQGPLRIPHTAEYGAEEVVHRQEGEAQEVDAQIDRRQRQDLVGGLHQPEHGFGNDYAQQGEEDAAHGPDEGGGLHGLPHAPVVPGPEVPGGQDAGPGAQTHEQVDEQLHQGAVGAYGGQGGIPAQPPHHDQVCGVEGQLQDTRQHHGDRKGYQLRQEPPLAEVDLMTAFHILPRNRRIFAQTGKA